MFLTKFPLIAVTVASLSSLFSVQATAQTTLSPDPSTAPDGSIMAAWTQISGNNSQSELEGYARFIVAGTSRQSSCGLFTFNTSQGTAPIDSRNNVVPADFPVTVCEVLFDTRWTQAQLQQNGSPVQLWDPSGGAGATVSFPTVHSVGRRNNGILNMVSVGDTGCRDIPGEQTCNSPDDWPFKQVSDAATLVSADFILHVGDYRYSNKGYSDQWKYWYEEFFFPAQTLLLDAPWAFVRGNHEMCGYRSTEKRRAPWGTGWFYFLQHESTANQLSCGNVAGDQAYQNPWYFDVAVHTGGSTSVSHRIIVMDSSTVDLSQKQVDNFTDMLQLSDAVNSSWWTGHRPLWGLARYNGKQHILETNLEQDLTSALAQYGGKSTCWADQGLPCSFKTMIAGHIHNLQRLQFFGAGSNISSWIRPQQYISGNSGVDLSGGFNANPCSNTLPQGAPSVYGKNLNATVDWERRFGFTLWQRDATTQAGWSEERYFYDNGSTTHYAPAQLDGNSGQGGC